MDIMFGQPFPKLDPTGPSICAKMQPSTLHWIAQSPSRLLHEIARWKRKHGESRQKTINVPGKQPLLLISINWQPLKPATVPLIIGYRLSSCDLTSDERPWNVCFLSGCFIVIIWWDSGFNNLRRTCSIVPRRSVRPCHTQVLTVKKLSEISITTACY